MSAAPIRKVAATVGDAELFARIENGELGALGELFDRHHASVRAFVVRLLPGSADLDDLVQETFLTAARAAASFEAGASGRPFLLGVAAQLARRRRRSFARVRAMLERLSIAPTTPTTSPEDHASDGQRARLALDALERLSHAHREALLLVDLGELSGVEAAKALGIPPGTLWRRLHEARANMAEHVRRRTR